VTESWRDREAGWGGLALMNLVLRIATPVLLFLTALIVRLLSWHSVYQSGGVYPNGNDAYYHLRRIRYTLENFPEVLRLDPLMNFPDGGQSIWPATFDWLIAALLLVLPGIDTSNDFEKFAMWIPPILGALTIVIVYALSLRFFGRMVAVVSALAMAILPAHSLYSRLGALDHHVLVAMVVFAMLGFSMALIRAEATGNRGHPFEKSNHRDRLALSIGLGISIGIAVLVWPGSLLQIGLLQIGLIVRLLTAESVMQAMVWTRRFAVVHLVAFILVLPMTIGNEWQLWGSFSPLVLSNFQPTYFLAASICFLLLGGIWRFGPGEWTRRTRLTRLTTTVLVGSGLVVGVFLAVPELFSAISEALSWLAKDEEFQSMVNESVPLFAGDRGVARAESFLSRFVYLAPFAIAYFAWQFRHRAEVLLLLGWGLALFITTLVQWRFMNSYSIVHCILIGLVAQSLYHALEPRLKGSVQRTLATLGALAVLAFVFMPSVHSYGLHFKNFGRALRGEPTIALGAQHRAKMIVDAARFLKEHSPGERSPFLKPEYSVLGPWGDGHILKCIAERAVVQDNFGDDVAPENFARAEAYFSSRNESQALEILAPAKTRYVFIRSTGSGHSERYSYESLFARLYRLRGNRRTQLEANGKEFVIEDSLARHRLIYQSPHLDEESSEPYVMIFEIVAGAEIIGRATPDSIITASLDISPREGARFSYSTSTVTNAAGIYAFRLPYSNQALSPNVRIGSHYTMRAGQNRGFLVVPEAAILSGRRIEGPRLGK
jgi:dolichyl-diphosphooligosaccharide--protein glycosyltransferase